MRRPPTKMRLATPPPQEAGGRAASFRPCASPARRRRTCRRNLYRKPTGAIERKEERFVENPEAPSDIVETWSLKTIEHRRGESLALVFLFCVSARQAPRTRALSCHRRKQK